MLLVRAARLFDGDRMVRDATVLVDEGRVREVGLQPPDGVDVLDLGDVTLLPGLVDCHQHLCFDGSGTLEAQVAGVDDEELARRVRQAAQRALLGGVTTLRDLGDRGFTTLALRDDPSLPTILVSGPPLTRVGGHCWYLGGECADDRDLRAAVAERIERGVDVVKVMASGGALTPTFPMWESQFSAEELSLVVRLAHAAGLPVAAHCHGVGAIEQALDARADTIEHCTFFTPDGRCDPPEALVARVASSGVTVSATMGRLPGVPLDPMIARNVDAIRAARRRIHELGGTIVAGTDAGITPAKPHDVLPCAYEDLLFAGLSPLEGLRALTSVPATALGLGHRKGRLAPGFDADLVAVSGDPLSDPNALTALVGVWRAGSRVR